MKLILILSVLSILYLLNKKNIVEPIVLSCCGNVKLGSDFESTDPDPPKKIKRCLKSWGMPCTNIGSPDCCEGIDTCKQTHEGGKCRKRDGSGYYIYDKYGSKKDYSAEDEKKERKRKRKKLIKERKKDGALGDIKDKMKNVNYILAGLIGVIVIFLTGILITKMIKKDFKKTVNKTDNMNKYKSSRYDKYDSDSFSFNRRR